MFHSPTGCRSVTSVHDPWVSPQLTRILLLEHRSSKLFVCLLGSGRYRLIFYIKLNKINYIILVGAPRPPKKEPNAGIEEIISTIKSATYPAKK